MTAEHSETMNRPCVGLKDAPSHKTTFLPSVTLHRVHTLLVLLTGAMVCFQIAVEGTIVAEIVAAFDNNCVKFCNSSMQCWGSNSNSQLGIASSDYYVGNTLATTPVNFTDIDSASLGLVTHMAIGGGHICFAVANNLLYCMGSNNNGQLGYGDNANRGSNAISSPPQLAGVNYSHPVVTISKIGLGNSFTCLVLIDNTLKCWGDNYYKQLGFTDTTTRGIDSATIPYLYASLATALTGTIKKISCGNSFACLLSMNGSVQCWGDHTFGQLGIVNTTYNSSKPLNHRALTFASTDTLSITDISAGSFHVCALFSVKKVKCWGQNSAGEIGYGDTVYRGDQPSTIPSSLAYLTLSSSAEIISVCAGSGFSCVLFKDSDIACWGTNGASQHGTSASSTSSSPPFTPYASSVFATIQVSDDAVTSMVCGSSHVCVLLSTGYTKCWGAGSTGATASGSFYNVGGTDATRPYVLNTTSYKSKTCTTPTCTPGYFCPNNVLVSACPAGRYGAGTTNYGPSCTGPCSSGYYCPTNSTSATQIACSASYVSKCPAGTKAHPPFITQLIRVPSANASTNSASRMAFEPWGEKEVIRIIGENFGSTLSHVSVNLGDGTTCSSVALLSTTEATCEIEIGALGTYNLTITINGVSSTPDVFPATPYAWQWSRIIGSGIQRNIESAQIVSAGSSSVLACVKFCDSKVNCFGAINSGTSGVNATYDPEATSTSSSTLYSNYDTYFSSGIYVKSFALGYSHTCYLLSNNQVKCIGQGAGTGLGSTMPVWVLPNDASPVNTSHPAKTIEFIAAGIQHTCVTFTDQTFNCWGDNAAGQLSRGDILARGGTPATVPGMNTTINISMTGTVTKLKIGANSNCLLTTTYQLKCWGDNTFGQLGYGDTTNRGNTPSTIVPVLPLVLVISDAATITDFAMGGGLTCALFNNGKFKCWGLNTFGQLGIGDSINRGGTSTTLPSMLTYVSGSNDYPVIQIAPSLDGFAACLVLLNGKIKCFGQNTVGQLGYGDTTNRGSTSATSALELPEINADADGVASIVMSGASTCSFSRLGKMKCWGLGVTSPPGSTVSQRPTICANPVCEVRHYCVSNSIHNKCPPGRFGNSNNNYDNLCSGPCSPGYYCPYGSIANTEVECPAGTYGISSGLGTSACSGDCMPGFYCPPISITSNPFPCTAGDYFYQCQRPGTKAHPPIISQLIRIGGPQTRFNSTDRFTFDTINAGDKMKILGNHFGNVPSVLRVFFGDGTECVSPNLVSNTEIVCNMLPGLGKSWDVVVSLYNQVNSTPSVIPANPVYRWGRIPFEVFRIHNIGKNIPDNSTLLTGNGTLCLQSVKVSNVSAVLAPYLSPTASMCSSVMPSLFLARGGEWLLVEGFYFGLATTNTSAYLFINFPYSSGLCSPAYVLNDSMIVCRTPAGMGSGMNISLQGHTWTGSGESFFRRRNPDITKVTPEDQALSAGSTSPTIEVRNVLTPWKSSISVSIGGVNCPNITTFSDSYSDTTSDVSVTCILPSTSSGKKRPLTVTMGPYTSTPYVRLFDFAAANPSSFPDVAPTVVPWNVSGSRSIVDPQKVVLKWNYASIVDVVRFRVVFSRRLAHLALITGCSDSSIPASIATEIFVRSVEPSSCTALNEAESEYLCNHEEPGLSRAPYFVAVCASQQTALGPRSNVTNRIIDKCFRDEYFRNYGALDEQKCFLCPSGASCNGGDVSSLKPLQGYWRVSWSVTADEFLSCPNPDACVGLLVVNGSIQDNGTSSLITCAPGYTSTLCSTCETGYSQGAGAAVPICSKCANKDLIVLSSMGGILAVLVVIAVMVKLALGNDPRKLVGEKKPPYMAVMKILTGHLQQVALVSSYDLKWPESMKGFFATSDTATSASDNVMSLQCAIGDKTPLGGFPVYGRILFVMMVPIIIVSAFSIFMALKQWRLKKRKYPGDGEKKKDESEFSEANPIASKRSDTVALTDKPDDHAIDVATAKTGDTVALTDKPDVHTIDVAIAKTGGTVTTKFEDSAAIAPRAEDTTTVENLDDKPKSDEKPKPVILDRTTTLENFMNTWVIAVVVIVVYTHPTVSKSIFQLFSCTKVGAGESAKNFLIISMDVDCNSALHTKYQIFLGIPFLILYCIGVPAFVFFNVYLNRKELRENKTSAMQYRYAYIITGYSDSGIFWESVVMSRKMSIAFMSISLAPYGVATQSIWGIAVYSFFSTLHSIFQPYGYVLLNRLESMSFGVTVITFCMGMLLTLGAEITPGTQVLITLLMVVLNAMFLVVCVTQFGVTAGKAGVFDKVLRIVNKAKGKCSKTASVEPIVDSKPPTGEAGKTVDTVSDSTPSSGNKATSEVPATEKSEVDAAQIQAGVKEPFHIESRTSGGADPGLPPDKSMKLSDFEDSGGKK